MTYGYEEALARRAASVHPALAGGSGYFAARSKTLDPSLFEEGDHLRSRVRQVVLGLWHQFCDNYDLRSADKWSRLWIAGSGITTAWDADREANNEPGDLDVLLGIDYGLFTSYNSSWQGSKPEDIAHTLNQLMHDKLWPHTGHIGLGASVYEVTYYINPGVGDGHNDLLAINPYAAYDVSADEWTLHPVQVPEGFSADYFGKSDRDQVADDLRVAQHVLGEFHRARQQLQQGPHELHAMRYLHEVVRAGAERFSAIHDGRKTAFAPGGKGYFDAANFRWQAGKGNGAITVLRALKQLDEQAHADSGMPCDNIGHLTLMAALANGGVKYR